MSYFLKKTTPSKKGLYLQIYHSYYIPGVGKRNKSYLKMGYFCDLEKEHDDPIAYCQSIVNSLNDDEKNKNELQISDTTLNKNLGYFLVKAMFDLLDMDDTINIVASNFKCKYSFSDLFRTIVYTQIISPGSKLKAFEKVIPSIYGVNNFSYDQILDFTKYIGSDYHKYIEILNKHISNIWKRNCDTAYFDCTNYYFEMDLEKEWVMKGPSKENHLGPLLGQSLMLDADQIPIDTEFYPGNQSEKPYLRKRVEDMKIRNNITGKVIQVADKGLNCARNIYAAVVESNDGYIFSKSLRGTSITSEQRKWIFDEDDEYNKFISVRDESGTLLYRYKTVKTRLKDNEYLDYADYEYHCKLNKDDKFETTFTVKEKRIVTYSPVLAKKQKIEILKEVEKAKKRISYKEAIKSEFGDSAKYIIVSSKTIDGKKVKIATQIDEAKVQQDLELAGYNMIITSEINADPIHIYNVYHNLWRIEESFRIMKTYLEARPAFVSSENSIHGHFLICYVALTIMRLIELKIFKDEIPIARLFEFIRQYNITKTKEDAFINTSSDSSTYRKIKEELGLSKLGNVYLSKRDVELLLKTEFDVEPIDA